MKLKVGDIFTIPISEEKVGFGQIINIPLKGGIFIMVVFEKVYTGRDWPSLTEIISDKILFLGYSLDALLYHKAWKIIGNNSSNIAEIKLPYYKLGTFPNIQIVNYKGDKVRKASKEEFNKLEYETVVAPVRYENALKAFHKLGEWKEDYDRLLYDRTLETVKVAEGK